MPRIIADRDPSSALFTDVVHRDPFDILAVPLKSSFNDQGVVVENEYYIALSVEQK